MMKASTEMMLSIVVFAFLFWLFQGLYEHDWHHSIALLAGASTGLVLFLGRFLRGESKSEPPWARELAELGGRVARLEKQVVLLTALAAKNAPMPDKPESGEAPR